MSTLRQQIREKAAERLDEITSELCRAADKVSKDTGLLTIDLMRLCSQTQTATLKHQCITTLANQIEAVILKTWNDQQDLPLAKDKK